VPIQPIPAAGIEVPEEVSRLEELAYNLWWCWTPLARRLFSSTETQIWATYRNPVELLINIEPQQWETVLADGGTFMSDYWRVMRDFDRYMDPEKKTEFKRQYPGYQGGPVAYVGTEFGLHESLGIYSGGLGILSGDHAKAASDIGLPFVGIGVMYRKGYFHQTVDLDGRQHHTFQDFDFYRLPLRPLHTATGRDLIISVDFPDRDVYVRVWQLTIGRVNLYLLDTDIVDNDPVDRPITSQLYVRGREMRLCQELVLGVGAVKALRELGIEPAVWHMNEGHSAFLLVERLRELLRAGVSWVQAVEQIRASVLFTTHTPVSAGHEVFDMSLVQKYMTAPAESMGVDVKRVLDLGLSYPGGGGQPFNLTALAVRMSCRSNGVSKLHGQVANQMWRHLSPDVETESHPIKYVTNGVHVATWLGHEIRTLIEEEIGADWQENLCNEEYWQQVKSIADEDLWRGHSHQKQRLIRLVRNRLVEQWARHGKSPDEMREAADMLNPNTLTIGFARRFTTYKRAGLIFQDYNRLRDIISNSERPVQIIFSGKAHPADVPGQELIQHIVNIAFQSDLRGYVFFLEDYEIRIARHLVQGVDIWLNTPRRPREASGTSGMKAAMNGAMNLSVCDGWWPEAYNGRNGWMIGDDREFDNHEMQDYEDSASFYDILEHQVIPLYYENRERGLPPEWVAMMKESMATIIPAFNSVRMVEDYLRDAYMPIARHAAEE